MDGTPVVTDIIMSIAGNLPKNRRTHTKLWNMDNSLSKTSSLVLERLKARHHDNSWLQLYAFFTLSRQCSTFFKGKGRTLVIAPLCRQAPPQRRSAQVHGAHQAASHKTALYLPSRSWYSFTDHERMEGWVNPGPGCKEQLAHGCYATACGQRDWNPDLAIVSPAR